MIRLNYKRFAFSISSFGTSENQNAGANVSSVNWWFTVHTTNGSYDKTGNAWYKVEATDGSYSTGQVSCKINKNTDTSFSGTTGNFGHNADGSLGAKTFKVTVYETANYKSYTSQVTQYFTTYPRYFSRTPSLSLSSKTNTQFNFSWSTSESASAVYYDIYNSSGGLIASSGNVGTGTSGTFSITGLSGATTYKVRIRATRADSGLSSESATGTYSTYTTPTLTVSLTSRTETSLKVKATPNVAVASKSWTVKNSAGTTVKTSTSTAETVEFTGLTANTNYTVYVSYVSTSANGSIASSTYNATYATLQYPYVSAVGTSALTIGNSQTLTLYNPLSRSVTVYMKKDSTSGTQLYSGTTTGTSITFTPNATTLYNTIPNATSANAVYYCVYSNQNVGTKSGTYKTVGTELPTFSTSDWSYAANLTALTNNDQVVIPNYSTVTFTLDSLAEAKNGSSITAYNVIWNDTLALNGTTVGSTQTISGKTSSSLSMVAKDSRGYQTTAPYVSPTIENIGTHRTDGIQAQTTLEMSGKFYATNFGGNGVTNTLHNVKYYTKLSTSDTWSTGYDIPVSNFTIDTDRGTFRITDFQIHANGTSGGFTVGSRYDIKVEVRDGQSLLGVATATSSVTDGKIARDVYQDSNGEYHEGINGRANANFIEYIHGNVSADGQFRKDLAGQWIQDRDYAVVRNNNNGNTNGYAPVVSQKTKDGNWTIGCYHDNALIFDYTSDTNYNNNTNTSNITKLYSDGTFDGKVQKVAHIDLTGQTTTLLSIVKNLGANGIKDTRIYYTTTDGGSSGISDKPTGSTNTGFCCYVTCNRWASASDYRYVLRAYAGDSYREYVTYVRQNTSAISWNLTPVLNASSTVQGGIKIRYDSTSKNLYITNNGNNP